MTEFQSHEPEFDYLKSLEIEEKINKVRWCRSSNNTRMLLSTNDKTVKLWKVGTAGSWPMICPCWLRPTFHHVSGAAPLL